MESECVLSTVCVYVNSADSFKAHQVTVMQSNLPNLPNVALVENVDKGSSNVKSNGQPNEKPNGKPNGQLNPLFSSLSLSPNQCLSSCSNRLLLLLCGDIERNPGPVRGSSTNDDWGGLSDEEEVMSQQDRGGLASDARQTDLTRGF